MAAPRRKGAPPQRAAARGSQWRSDDSDEEDALAEELQKERKMAHAMFAAHVRLTPTARNFQDSLGGGMDDEDIPLNASGECNDKQLRQLSAVVNMWTSHYMATKQPASRRSFIPGYEATNITMDGVGVPMRLTLSNISARYPGWAKKRIELLGVAKMFAAKGDIFGANVSMNKKGVQRLSIPLGEKDLQEIVSPDSRGPVNLDEEVQRHILPYLRNNQKTEFALIKVSLFIDPPGSSVQENHMDVEMFDRNQIWNLVLPIQAVPSVPMAAMERSEITGATIAPRRVDEDTAIMWDGNWKHRGVGNTTTETRVMLHLLYVPVWMLVSPFAKKSLSYKYNSMQDVDNITTPVGEWIQRYHEGPPEAAKQTHAIVSARA